MLTFGDDPSDHDPNVVEAGLPQSIHQLRYDQVVSGQRTEADDLYVFLERDCDHSLQRLPGRGVNHFHAGITQVGCHDATSAIMSVQADLGHQNARREIQKLRLRHCVLTHELTKQLFVYQTVQPESIACACTAAIAMAIMPLRFAIFDFIHCHAETVMSKSHALRVTLFATAIALLLLSVIAEGSTSNKWRLQFSGKANSDGTIVLKLSPEGKDPITAEIQVKDNTGENGVAKTVVRALKAQLPKDRFHVERDDGEDVLIKKRHGTENFGLEIVSNSVKGVRINPDRE